ncbi:hypothetical protein TNCV_5101791 [Trichonephila clavipes]|nr:hypothetical protein TNCV_5101791 [Trichonephila clavipes]
MSTSGAINALTEQDVYKRRWHSRGYSRIVVANATCLKERGPRNSSSHGQEVRLSLALSTIQVTVRFKLGETPRRDDRWRHDLYLHLHNFCKLTEGEGNFLQFLRS